MVHVMMCELSDERVYTYTSCETGTSTSVSHPWKIIIKMKYKQKHGF